MACLVQPYWTGSFQYAYMCRSSVIKQLALSRWWSNLAKNEEQHSKKSSSLSEIFFMQHEFSPDKIFSKCISVQSPRLPDDDQIGQKWGTTLKKCSCVGWTFWQKFQPTDFSSTGVTFTWMAAAAAWWSMRPRLGLEGWLGKGGKEEAGMAGGPAGSHDMSYAQNADRVSACRFVVMFWVSIQIYSVHRRL